MKKVSRSRNFSSSFESSSLTGSLLLQDLPNDLLEKVLGYLLPSDLQSAGAAAKFLRAQETFRRANIENLIKRPKSLLEAHDLVVRHQNDFALIRRADLRSHVIDGRDQPGVLPILLSGLRLSRQMVSLRIRKNFDLLNPLNFSGSSNHWDALREVHLELSSSFLPRGELGKFLASLPTSVETLSLALTKPSGEVGLTNPVSLNKEKWCFDVKNLKKLSGLRTVSFVSELGHEHRLSSWARMLPAFCSDQVTHLTFREMDQRFGSGMEAKYFADAILRNRNLKALVLGRESIYENRWHESFSRYLLSKLPPTLESLSIEPSHLFDLKPALIGPHHASLPYRRYENLAEVCLHDTICLFRDEADEAMVGDVMDILSRANESIFRKASVLRLSFYDGDNDVHVWKSLGRLRYPPRLSELHVEFAFWNSTVDGAGAPERHVGYFLQNLPSSVKRVVVGVDFGTDSRDMDGIVRRYCEAVLSALAEKNRNDVIVMPPPGNL